MDDINSANSYSKTVFLILICFFLSGFTGLIYEILWIRMIVKLIGGAPFAVSIVLTIFMAGLGLGSYIASRTIDRIKNPANLVGLYGLLQIIIGIYGLLIPLFLTWCKPLFSILYNQFFEHFMLYNFLTFIECSVLLCIPVICMGATLPILCKFYVNTMDRLGTNAGRLYGLNTIGAALGSLACGFWFLSIWGMRGTLYFAVAMNLVIGFLCLLNSVILRSSCKKYIAEETLIQQAEPQPAEKDQKKGLLYGALIIFAVSGFCSMAYEVTWTKLLGLLVGPTTYSFTIVLVTFILGLALGSMFFGYLADKFSKPMTLLICTQIIAGLLALGVSQILGNSQLFFAKLLFTFQEDFALQNALKGVVLFCFMILPTLCLGATFPLVSKIYTQRMANIGRSIGFAYTINTIGAVLGSFCAGFVLIPLFGKEMSIRLLVSLQLICALLIALVVMVKSAKLKLIPLAVPVLAGVVLCFYFPQWNREQLTLGKYHRFDEYEKVIKNVGWLESLKSGRNLLEYSQQGEIVYFSDGIGGFITVMRYVNPLGGYYYKLIISGKTDATSHGDMPTQTLSAHFPLVFHPNPKKVMVLGLASGVTAGEVLDYPIDQLDVLEISKQVVTASDFFRPWNSDVLSDPRTNLIVQDGRAHLQLTDQMYDVIISEPSNPWMSGLATLFTKDFFELCKDRMTENGILVQWVHTYQMDWQTVELIGRTFTDIFPNNIMIATEPAGFGADYLMVGFKNGANLSLQTAQQNFAYTQKSKNIKLRDPKLFYRMIVAENLKELFGPGPVNSDVQPILEFSAPKLIYHSDTTIQENITSNGVLREETQNIVEQLYSNIDSQIDFAEYAFSVNSPFKNMVNVPKASTEQRERFYKFFEDFVKRDVIKYNLIGDPQLRQRCIGIQKKQIEENVASMGSKAEKAACYKLLGEIYLKNKMLDESVESYVKALKFKPEDSETHYNLGIAYAQKGLIDQARKTLERANNLSPQYTTITHKILGIAFFKHGKTQEAITAFRKYLQEEPDDFQIHNQLGAALGQVGQVDLAIQHFKQALKINPEYESALENLHVARSLKNSSQKTTDDK